MSFLEWIKNPVPILAKDLFGKMPLAMFIEFATVLEDPSLAEGYGPFKLWPKQEELANHIDINHPAYSKVVVLAKRRQTGGSETMSALVAKILITEPRAQIVVISRNEDEAEYFLTTRVKPKLKNLPQFYKDGAPLIIYPKFLNLDRLYIQTDLGHEKDASGEIQGSNVTAVASHPDAGSGRTVRLIIMDEAEKIEHASKIWTSVRPAVEQNPKGQLIVLSSGQKNGTWFKSILLRRLYDGKIKGALLFFMSRWADPRANQKWWDDIKTQFDNEIDARAAYPETIEDLFLTPEGKVFPHFDEKIGGRHVQFFDIGHQEAVNWTFKFITAMDPGQVHPAAFLMTLYNPFDDMLYVFDEIVKKNLEIAKIGAMINERLSRYPIRPQRNLCDTALFKKTGTGITEGQILSRVTGMQFVGAYKADADGSRQMLSMRLSANKIIIHPRCQETIVQMRDWVFNERGEPVDVGDDTIDDLRYICADIRGQSRLKPKVPYPAYSRERGFLIKKAKAELRVAKHGTQQAVKTPITWLSG